MEATLKSIASNTARMCRERGIQADMFTIAYWACLQEVCKGIQVAAPGASIQGDMSPAQVAAVSDLVAKHLTDKDSPILATAKIQVLMEVLFKQQQELVVREAAEREERVGMLARGVTEARVGEGVVAQERLFSRVLEYVCVAGGMERALNDDAAKEEVRLAMESVFPLSTLVRFSTLDASDRLQQLESLARITAGICLFNQALGRAGLALPPGPASYLPQAQRLLRDIARHVASLSADVECYAALIHMNTPTQGADPDAAAEAEMRSVRERAQVEAVHTAQVLVLWEGLQSDLAAGLQAVGALEAELQHWVLQVSDAVGSAAAVAKAAVLPSFDRLGAIQSALGEELRLLVVRQRLADGLQELQGAAGYVTLLQRAAKMRRPGRKTPMDAAVDAAHAARDAWGSPQAPAQLADGCQWVAPPAPGQPSALAGPHSAAQEGQAADVQQPDPLEMEEGMGQQVMQLASALRLELNGFDPILLATQSRLCRAQAELGYLTYNQATYGFSSPDTLAQFAANPSTAVAAVHAAIVRQPVLARLLGRTAAFPSLDLPLIVRIMSGPLKVDFCCQTPTHFVEKNIDYSYEWNEWALRRRALALANLRQKKTHSAQTGLSHFKRDCESQVWQPKAAVTQTKVNKGQAMPRKLQYVAGLRGAPSTKMNVVRLELDVGQPHQH